METSEINRGESYSLEQLAIELAEMDPRPIDYFTPENLKEVVDDFLSGDDSAIEKATYSTLDSLDFAKKQRDYEDILFRIASSPATPPNHIRTYQNYVAHQIKINELMEAAVAYRTSTDNDSKEMARQKFISLNEEIYGAVEPLTAISMAKEILEDTSTLGNPELVKIRQDFQDLLPAQFKAGLSEAGRIRQPGDETREFVKRMAELIYPSFIKHAEELISAIAKEENISEDELKLEPQPLAVIFQTIIDREFPDSGWHVVVGPANAIKVTAATKTVTVKEDRKSVNVDKAKGLVVHELGVHMLRSIIGEGSDLLPLRFGLQNVDDAEEGLANALESSISGQGTRTGYQHYLTVALLSSGYSFKYAFEVMWRYKVLDAYLDKTPKIVDKKYIDKQKLTTVRFMIRSVRGTNGLPWHITLSYFNGSRIWEYIEDHLDDPDLSTLLFMGKSDPRNIDHLKSALEARGRA